MSRLDSAIRRLQAQRACLDAAAGLIEGVSGPVLELGLGNGRTYDHLRTRLPRREIFVFERQVAAHPSCIPDKAHLLLGDLAETLPKAAPRFAGMVALLHADLGSGDDACDTATAALVAGYLDQLMAPGGIIVADLDLSFPGAERLALPVGVAPGRYLMLRVGE